MQEFLPPQNTEAERAVLGSILIDEYSFHKISHLLNKEMFYDPRNTIVFSCLENLSRQNKPLDILTITEELKKEKKLQEIGGSAYISEIVASVPTFTNVVEYANIIKEKSLRRKLIHFSKDLVNLVKDESVDINTVVDKIESNVVGIAVESEKQDFYSAGQLIEKHIEQADEYARNPEAVRGLPTGLASLDEILGGFHKSDLIIIAARPGVGKSAISLSFARHLSVYHKKSVAFFSLEMPGVQLIQRILAQETEIDMWSLRMGRLKDEDYSKVAIAQAKLSETKLKVDETSGINIIQLRSKARKLMLEEGLDLIIIDYLQLMQGSGNIESRAQEVGEISRSLKILARELNIPIIALSQLNRAVENRPDRMPQLSDLRESGSIEQDADLVMFLSRDISGNEEEQSETIKKVDVFIAKHRNGRIGKIKLEFNGALQKFYSI